MDTNNFFVSQTNSHPIVVIAASAGGLTAIDELLSELREDNNASYFILQHLANDNNCALINRLKKSTSMPVVAMSDGILTQLNTVYVLPPNHIPRLVEKKLFVSEAPNAASAHPVDVFCTSIAEQTHMMASAVFLSGAGSDGCAGANAMKSAGHEILVQSPETARFPNLPARIIEACTSVDFVISPKAIAAQLNGKTKKQTRLVQYSANEALSGMNTNSQAVGNDQQVLRGMNAELHERIAFLENKIHHLQALHTERADTPVQACLTPLSVLVVDTDSSDRKRTRALLDAAAGEQYEVSEASSAGEAMQLLTEHHFDLCVLDYRLDNITASALLESLPECLQDTSFLVISSQLDLVIQDNALNASAVPALDKTRLTPEIFRDNIENATRSHGSKKAQSVTSN